MYSSDHELVDVLQPPTFKKTGVVKTKEQAYNSGDWIATYNLWVVQNKPRPAILFQRRSLTISLEPGKLDVTSGGHYQKGEALHDGLREVKEELGKIYQVKDIIPVGRRIYLGIDSKKRLRKNIVYTYVTIDNSNLSSYHLDHLELAGLFILPIQKLVNLFAKNIPFIAYGIDSTGQATTIKVNKSSFPYNFDNYYYRFTILADRLLKGEKHIII
jgi:hypothetical protein